MINIIIFAHILISLINHYFLLSAIWTYQNTIFLLFIYIIWVLILLVLILFTAVYLGFLHHWKQSILNIFLFIFFKKINSIFGCNWMSAYLLIAIRMDLILINTHLIIGLLINLRIFRWGWGIKELRKLVLLNCAKLSLLILKGNIHLIWILIIKFEKLIRFIYFELIYLFFIILVYKFRL